MSNYTLLLRHWALQCWEACKKRLWHMRQYAQLYLVSEKNGHVVTFVFLFSAPCHTVMCLNICQVSSPRLETSPTSACLCKIEALTTINTCIATTSKPLSTHCCIQCLPHPPSPQPTPTATSTAPPSPQPSTPRPPATQSASTSAPPSATPSSRLSILRA